MTDSYPVWVQKMALTEYMFLCDQDRDADNLRLKLSIACNHQVQIPVETLQNWIDYGLDIVGRPDLKQPWEELKAQFDKGVWDPEIGFVETGVRNKRLSMIPEDLEKITHQMLRDPAFKNKIRESPDLLNRFNQRFNVGDISAESVGSEQLIEMMTKLINKEAASFIELIGPSARRKLREAISKYRG